LNVATGSSITAGTTKKEAEKLGLTEDDY